MNTHLPNTLSDGQLVDEVKRLAGSERHATVALLRALAEFDTRRLYLRQGCSSLFTYCTQELHLSEASAFNRIETARAARRFPVVFEAIAEGALTLTSVRLLAPHLTDGNYARVLAAARHRTRREVEELVAALNPQPSAQPVIRRVAPAQAPPTPESLPVPTHARDENAPHSADTVTQRPALAAIQNVARHIPLATVAVKPVAPDLYRLHVTLSGATCKKLGRAQQLLRHSVPSGDPAEILDRALGLLVEQLERRRFAKVTSPRDSGRTGTPGSRRVPAAVRREVWRRDEGRCAYVGPSGRCCETAFLEFHHVQPYAAGGPATVGNIQLRCRAHNQFEAELFSGNVAREALVSWDDRGADGEQRPYGANRRRTLETAARHRADAQHGRVRRLDSGLRERCAPHLQRPFAREGEYQPVDLLCVRGGSRRAALLPELDVLDPATLIEEAGDATASIARELERP